MIPTLNDTVNPSLKMCPGKKLALVCTRRQVSERHSRNLRIIQCPTVGESYNKIPYSSINGWAKATCINTDEFHKHNVERKNQIAGENIQYSISVKSENKHRTVLSREGWELSQGWPGSVLEVRARPWAGWPGEVSEHRWGETGLLCKGGWGRKIITYGGLIKYVNMNNVG